MLSQNLTRLAAALSSYEQDGCYLAPQGVQHFQLLLLDAAADARALELQVVPASARARPEEFADGIKVVALPDGAPRAAAAPPWGWGDRR